MKILYSDGMCLYRLYKWYNSWLFIRHNFLDRGCQSTGLLQSLRRLSIFTKWDCKQRKTVNKWRIVSQSIGMNKTGFIGTDKCRKHAQIYVILTWWNNMRVCVPWIENHESGSYKYSHCVETNVIAGKWDVENWEKWCDQSVWCKWENWESGVINQCDAKWENWESGVTN